MKNLKKTLSLVLVAVMMLGILTIGAGAAFTDEADVDYTEAVDVLSAIGVLEGFEDGSFKPDEILTREQAAKIIAYIMIGSTAADTLVTDTAPFSDVAATRWSAGYIAFCANQGILNGYGDGRFGPADTLTGFQFAKMLLCAIGYGQNDEFVGSNWTIEVAKFAIPIGLFEGNEEGASNAPCTREAAALYTFNAITGTHTVNYSELLGIYYSGQSALASETVFNPELTLGYQVFKLEPDSDTSAGRKGHYWMTNGVYITGFYSADTVIGRDTAGIELYDLTTKGEFGFIAQTDDEYTVYFNGVPLTDTPKEAAGGRYYDADNKSIMLADKPYNIKRGTVVELIDTDDPGTKADIINIIEKTIIFMSAAPLVQDDRVIIKDVGTFSVENVVGLEDISAYNVYVYSVIDGIATFEKCEVVSGKLTKIGSVRGESYYVISDNTYYKSELDGYVGDIINFKANETYYIDPFGNIAYVYADYTETTSYYGLLLDAEASSFGPVGQRGAYAQVQMLQSDGTVDVFDVINPETGLPNKALVDSCLDGTLGKGIGDIYKYNIGYDGAIISMTPSTYVETEFTAKNGTPVITGLTDNYFANSSTYFFYYNDDGTNVTYSVVKDFRSIPATQTAQAGAYIFSSDSYLRAVLFYGEKSAPAVDVIYISGMDLKSEFDGTRTYYSYPCYMEGKFYDGEKDMVKLLAPVGSEGPYSITKVAGGDYYAASPITSVPASIPAAGPTFFEYDGNIYTITQNTKVYKVSFGLDGKVTDVAETEMEKPDGFFTFVNTMAFEYEDVGSDKIATVVFFTNEALAPLPESLILTENTLEGPEVDLIENPDSAVFSRQSYGSDRQHVNIEIGAVGADTTTRLYVMKAGTTEFELVGTYENLTEPIQLTKVAISYYVADGTVGTARIKVEVDKFGTVTNAFNATVSVAR